MVTSDDGYRPFQQFLEFIPSSYRANGKVLISTAAGATLYEDMNGKMVEVPSYWEEVQGETQILPIRIRVRVRARVRVGKKDGGRREGRSSSIALLHHMITS